MKRTIIISKKDGSLQWLNPPPFNLPVTDVTRQRYSEIVPLDPLLCLWFRILRWTFGEDGKVSDWTRAWRVMWQAKILVGPHRGSEFITPFRQAALDWEKEKFSEPKFNL